MVHECLVTDQPHALATLEEPSVLVRHDCARSRDPNTYAKDARLLETALAQNPSDTRTAVNLAQSLRDGGDLARSVAAYRLRAAMGGWDEEVWFSLYQIARLEERRGAYPSEVARAYLAAYAYRSTRAEPLEELARFHRTRCEFALAHLYAARAAAIAPPPGLLFVEDDAYRWRALDALAISAFYVGQHAEGPGGHVASVERSAISASRARATTAELRALRDRDATELRRQRMEAPDYQISSGYSRFTLPTMSLFQIDQKPMQR